MTTSGGVCTFVKGAKNTIKTLGDGGLMAKGL
jgi:hypothetical protein